MTQSHVDVRRGADRAATTTDWLDSRHSFSFGAHYDPGNVGFGALVTHNEDVIAPGAGFDAHPHANSEIVTWVLSGALTYWDSAGRRGVARPGTVQRMSAGSGIEHSERNDNSDEPVRYLQMWVLPDSGGGASAYELRDVAARLDTGMFVPVVTGVPGHQAEQDPLSLRSAGATLFVARPRAGVAIGLPDAGRTHLFVARGAVDLDGIGPLASGDAVRVTGSTGALVHPADGATDTEILVWAMDDVEHGAVDRDE